MSALNAREEERIYTDKFVGNRSWNGRERNQLLLNRGDGRFVEVGGPLGVDSVRDGRGLAAADFDRDGDVDFVVNNYKAQAQLFDNRLGEGNGWLAVRLQGTRSNRDGIGAEILVVSAGVQQLRVVGAGHGYASQYSLEQLFGLGRTNFVERIEVRWPGGTVEGFGSCNGGQRVLLVEGAGNSRTAEPATTDVRGAVVLALVGVLGFLWIRREG